MKIFEFIVLAIVILACIGAAAKCISILVNWAIKHQTSNQFAKFIAFFAEASVAALVCLLAFIWISNIVTSCAESSPSQLPEGCYLEYDKQGSTVVCE